METAAGTTNSKFNPHSHCSPSPQPQFPLLRPAGVRVLPLRPVAATLEKKTPREMSPKPRRTFREFIMWTDDLGIMALCCARLESREWMVTSRRWRRWGTELDRREEGGVDVLGTDEAWAGWHPPWRRDCQILRSRDCQFIFEGERNTDHHTAAKIYQLEYRLIIGQ